MGKYYSNRDSYFEEPQTTSKSDKSLDVKQVVDQFNDKIVDSRYSIKRPVARKLGHVKKQN